MIYSIFIFFIFSILLILKNYKNKFAWMFAILFTGLNISLLAVLLYIVKLSNYTKIFRFDNDIYLFLSRLKVNFYDLTNLINVGVGIFLFSMWCFANFYHQNAKKMNLKTIISMSSTFALIIYYLWINSPVMSTKFYIMLHTAEAVNDKNFVLYLLDIIQISNYIIIAFYMLYPFITIGKIHRNTHIKIKKIHSAIICTFIVLMDVFFAFVFIFGPFRYLLFNKDDLLKMSNNFPWYLQYLYTYLPFVILLVLEILFIFSIKFKLLNKVDIFKKRVISRNTMLLAKDIRPVFHSYKNALLSIEILAMKATKRLTSTLDADTEILNNLNEIKSMTSESMNSVSKFLDMFNELKFSVEKVNVVNCINDAIASVFIPNEVTIDNQITFKEAFILGSSHYIKELFRNLFINAVEAIQSSNRKQGIITVTIEIETDWMCIFVNDNGCGIPKKDLKNIFAPLFSTKKTYKNWGIGLSHVSKIAVAHLGDVFVDSVENESTKFQVLLPTIGSHIV